MKRLAVYVLLATLPSLAALAQVDFSGEWDHPGVFGQEDITDRGGGPEIGDYLGLPLNEAGLAKPKPTLDRGSVCPSISAPRIPLRIRPGVRTRSALTRCTTGFGAS